MSRQAKAQEEKQNKLSYPASPEAGSSRYVLSLQNNPLI
jgi:hypothetical protein